MLVHATVKLFPVLQFYTCDKREMPTYDRDFAYCTSFLVLVPFIGRDRREWSLARSRLTHVPTTEAELLLLLTSKSSLCSSKHHHHGSGNTEFSPSVRLGMSNFSIVLMYYYQLPLPGPSPPHKPTVPGSSSLLRV